MEVDRNVIAHELGVDLEANRLGFPVSHYLRFVRDGRTTREEVQDIMRHYKARYSCHDGAVEKYFFISTEHAPLGEFMGELANVYYDQVGRVAHVETVDSADTVWLANPNNRCQAF